MVQQYFCELVPESCVYTCTYTCFLKMLLLCGRFPTGACQCQIMDCIIPGSIAMTKVKFDAHSEDDCKHNFRLLHEAFSKNGLTKVGIFLLAF